MPVQTITMGQFAVIYSSILSVNCHFIKERLEKEGIKCFIDDEHIITVHPFRAVSVGSVKLKVNSVDRSRAIEILSLIEEGFLTDEEGVYDLREALDSDWARQEKILGLRSRIRQDPGLLEEEKTLLQIRALCNDPESFIATERKYHEYRRYRFRFSWEGFWAELLDFEGNIFRYFRRTPHTFHLEEELLDLSTRQHPPVIKYVCPICSSDNVIRSSAIDHVWSVREIISLFIGALFIGPGIFVPRIQCHCFNCGNNFSAK